MPPDVTPRLQMYALVDPAYTPFIVLRSAAMLLIFD